MGVAGLLLSWGGRVSLRARDADNRVVFAFNTSDAWQAARDSHVDSSKPRSPHLTATLNTLTQANYISVRQWSAWVPVSASTTSLSIKGAISLEPAPTRNIQFISLGIRPLAPDDGNNEIYREVDRLFRLSSFGIDDEDADDEHKKTRRETDRRVKTSHHPDRQLKLRKGVDRHPMFHLRITLRESIKSRCSDDQCMHDETNVQTVVEVLAAMITQWLKAHHFRPVRPRQRRKIISDSGHVRAMLSADESISTTRTPRTCSSRDSVPHIASKASIPTTTGTTLQKRKRPGAFLPENTGEKQQNRAFAEWSRIKSGRADFFGESFAPQWPESSGVTADTWSKQGKTDTSVSHHRLGTLVSAKFATQPLAQGCLSTAAMGGDTYIEEPLVLTADSVKRDEPIVWVDPVTKKAHLLNARTGCAMPLPRTRSTTNPSALRVVMAQVCSTKSVRLPPKTVSAGQTPWLDGILQTWDNPIFRTSEQRIGQVSPQEEVSEHLHHPCSFGGEGEVRNVTTNRLSKGHLLEAEVLAQVDKKFILVRTKARPRQDLSLYASTTLLVLIDQHAADERIQVENLYRQLCSPAVSSSGYQSKLGHRAQVASAILEKPLRFTISQKERLHFTKYAGRFACWGVLFDIADSASVRQSLGNLNETSDVLSVTALPPSISERCRADTQLLISFLRSTVWNYASASSLPTYSSLNQHRRPSDWVGRLADCPTGLVDMINSRACRSAIMFNDELDMNQCKTLVRRLATCVFPFMCAHGRPSMVPLVDIDELGNTTEASRPCPNTNHGGFVQAWKQWKS